MTQIGPLFNQVNLSSFGNPREHLQRRRYEETKIVYIFSSHNLFVLRNKHIWKIMRSHAIQTKWDEICIKTTDKPYRLARSRTDGLETLRRCTNLPGCRLRGNNIATGQHCYGGKQLRWLVRATIQLSPLYFRPSTYVVPTCTNVYHYLSNMLLLPETNHTRCWHSMPNV